MTNIDDSTQTPPGYWFGVIEGRLHERMREALADQGLRRGGWRILHALAEGPASAAELGEKLPHRGDRGRDRHHDGDRNHKRDRHRDHGGDSDRDSAAYSEAAERDERADGHEYARRAHGCEHHTHGGGYGYGAYGAYGHHGYGQRHGDARYGDARYGDPRPGFTPGGHSHPGWRGQEPRDERPAGPSPEQGGAHEHHGDDPRGDQRGHHDHHGHDHPNAFERGYERGFDRGFAFGTVRAGHPFAAYPPHVGGPFPGGYPFPGPARDFGGPWGHRHHPFDRDRRGGRRGAHRIHRVLAEFVERGWAWFDGDRATLTDEGRAAHDEAFTRVQAVRAELANGISEQDYATTMSTLETMARNLGWQPGRPAGSQDGAPSMDA